MADTEDLFTDGTSKNGDQGTKEENEKNEIKDKKHCRGCYVPRRYVVTFLAAVGMMFVYCMRTNLSITAVTLLDEEALMKVGSERAMWNLPKLNWSTRMVGFLHSVFYIGYLSSHLPAGYLTTFWPCHRIYGGCILFSAALNLLLPLCIEDLGYVVTCSTRFLQGISEGLLYPACYGVLRHWSTTQERGRLVSSVLTGSYAGAILGFPLAGVITHYISWVYVYYVSGGFCVVWYFFWLCFVHEKPSHHASISDEELEYLNNAQGRDSIEYVNLEIPWRSILTSFPVIALCICHFVRNWVFVLMLTNEPYYLNMFGFSIAETGVYSSIPHIVKVMFAFSSGYIADFLLLNPFFTPTIVRKLLTGIGFIVQGLCFFILTVLSRFSGTLVLVYLSLGVGFFGISVAGWQINHYDLSARFASVLVSFTSFIGTFGAVAAPLVAGELLVGKNLDGWDKLFYITSAFLVFSAIFYCIFGSGEEQPWANPPPHVQLVQKQDPLAKKPYKIYRQQVPSKPEVNGDCVTIKTKSSKEDGFNDIIHRFTEKIMHNNVR